MFLKIKLLALRIWLNPFKDTTQGCWFALSKDRLVRSRVPEDGIWGTSLTYSLVADPIAEPGEGLWAGGRQLPHLFPESALELSPVLWCYQGPCKENGTGWDVAEENSLGDGVQTQPDRESPSAYACSH